MVKKPHPDDLALWKDAMREATPIRKRAGAKKPDVTAPAKSKPVVEKPKARDENMRKIVAGRAVVNVPPPLAPKPVAPPLERGQVAGVDKRQAERLRRGKTEIEGRIDLHGMTLENAHRRLTDFLEDAQDAGKRAVLVVTGKGVREGTGVIRMQVPRWLNEPRLRPLVLAYESAQPKDGGMGALYILLRRKR